MSARRFADWEFKAIGTIEPERDVRGVFLEMMPQARYAKAAVAVLHGYGAGPFCRFRVGRGQREAGLYVLTVNDLPVYAGECVDLSKRWGPNGYGGISPRNCFRGGQPTNCRVNAAILAAAHQGNRIELWFCPIEGSYECRRAAETRLIQALRPPWNRAKLR